MRRGCIYISKGRVEVHALLSPHLSDGASKITCDVRSQSAREPILFTFEEGPAPLSRDALHQIH